MRIASFVGQKGGVGKSTLARVLAVAAARAQHKVLIGDFDLEQLTCVEWGALRMRNGVEPEIEARAFKSLKKLRKTVEGYDLVVVDTRGLADELTEDGRPSPHIGLGAQAVQNPRGWKKNRHCPVQNRPLRTLARTS